MVSDPCLACDGRGSTDCPHCGGKGQSGGFLGVGAKACYGCDGEGRLTCEVCGGSGALEVGKPRPSAPPPVPPDARAGAPRPPAQPAERWKEAQTRPLDDRRQEPAGWKEISTRPLGERDEAASPAPRSTPSSPAEPARRRREHPGGTPRRPSGGGARGRGPAPSPAPPPRSAPDRRVLDLEAAEDSVTVPGAARPASAAPHGGLEGVEEPTLPGAVMPFVDAATETSPGAAGGHRFIEARTEPGPWRSPDEAAALSGGEDERTEPEPAASPPPTSPGLRPSGPAAGAEADPPEPARPLRVPAPSDFGLPSRGRSSRPPPGAPAEAAAPRALPETRAGQPWPARPGRAAPSSAASVVAGMIEAASGLAHDPSVDARTVDQSVQLVAELARGAGEEDSLAGATIDMSVGALAPAGDARGWLYLALSAAGRAPGEAEALAPSGAPGEAGGDLRALVEAAAILEPLVAAGRAELARDLAQVRLLEAGLREGAGDDRGAAACYGRAAALLEPLASGGQPELVEPLARATTGAALAAESSGELDEALALHGRAVELRQTLVSAGASGQQEHLARALVSRAAVLDMLGDRPGAAEAYAASAELLERLVEAGQGELEDELARAFMNQGVAREALGDLAAAAGLYGRAIALWEPMLSDPQGSTISGDLGWTLAYRAGVLDLMGEAETARAAARRAVEMLEAEVRRTGRQDLADVLQWARAELTHLL